MLLIVVIALAATTAGVLLDLRRPDLAHRASGGIVKLIIWLLMPFIVFFVTARLNYGGGLGVGLVFAYAELCCVALLAYVVCARTLHLPRPVTGSVVCATMLANTGYLGVPLSGALLGHEAITGAVAWDAMVSNPMLYGPAFAVGAAFGTEAGDNARERTIAFFTRNPVFYALVVGNLVPSSWSPDPFFDAAKWLAGFGVLPLGFFLLGVNLVDERGADGKSSLLPAFERQIAVVTGLRAIVAPALLAGLALLFSVRVPDAFYLQAAMPSGINTLVVAHLFGLDLRTGAAAVAWTHIVTLVALPVVMLLL